MICHQPGKIRTRILIILYPVFVLGGIFVFQSSLQNTRFVPIIKESVNAIPKLYRDGLEKLIHSFGDNNVTHSLEKSPKEFQKLTNVGQSEDDGDVIRQKQPKFTAVLFTSWIPNQEKNTIHHNVLKTWRLWLPDILPVVFTDHVSIRNQAKAHGWGTLTAPRRGCQSDIPLYREMFRESMQAYDSLLYGFVNGDILLGKNLLQSLQAVVRMPFFQTQPVMVIIERHNVDFVNRPEMDNVDNLTAIAHEGTPMNDGSSEGIFTNRLFPWDHVPDIVSGRRGIAMWMVSYARSMGVVVVDISRTTIAVHQTTQAGNKESHKKKDVMCNLNLIGKLGVRPKSWFCGFIRCAGYSTVDEGEHSFPRIKVKAKKIHQRCSECHMKVDILKKIVF